MEGISDMLMELLPRAARTGTGVKRDFQSKDRGEMKMKILKQKTLDNHTAFKISGKLWRRGRFSERLSLVAPSSNAGLLSLA